jgi:hypothetical protein
MKRFFQSGWNNLFQSSKETLRFLIVTSLLTPCALAILDTNNNGVSDFWERQYNDGELFPASFEPQADPDKDGWSNELEAAAGTDSDDPNPPNGLIRPATAVGTTVLEEMNELGEITLVTTEIVTVTWPTLVGKQYTLWFSPDLTLESWVPVEEPFIASGGENTYHFNELNLAEKRFWRVAVEDIDSDSDGLTNHEEYQFGTNPSNPETFAGIPDAWHALHYTTVIGFDPYDDDDNDELSNFEEYLHGTNPKLGDTDGDDTSDFAEVNHGGNPTDASDGGTTPADLLEEVAFTVGGDYASWRMEIHGKGPRDQRILRLASQNPGDTETRTFKLRRNNRYEITLHRTGGDEDWYCWEAAVDSKPESVTFDEGDGWISAGIRNDQAHFFTVAGHWLVDNRQGLLTSHLHSLGMDVASPLKAEFVPVAIEDNIEAIGVDIVSNSVAPDVPGYRDRLWIMAPIAGPPPPADYSNEMKFHIPLNPAAELDMACDHAIPNPATITLDGSNPAVLWRGSGVNETNENTTTFKIGEHDDEVDLPIGVMTMKHRTVKVAVYLVRRPESRPFPAFDEELILNELNKVFAYQINAWFNLKFYAKTISYDSNLDRNLILAAGLTEFSALISDPQVTAADPDFSPDIKVLLIDDIRFYVVDDPLDPELSPITGYTTTENICVLKVGTAITDASGNPQVQDKDPALVRQSVAHEIGHVMLGIDHPDKGGGPASLMSLQPDTRRLMYSLIEEIPESDKLLVKGEWDNAEAWLQGRTNGDN